jgi:hypothetical protein
MASRRDPPVESRPPLPLRRELLADIVAASSPPARAEQPRGRSRGKGQKRAKPGGRGGGRAKAIRAADRSDSPPPLAESPTHRTVSPVQEPPVQSAAPEAPEQRTTPPVQSEAPEQRTPPVQSEAPEAPRQSTEPRWDDPWEERARTDDDDAEDDDSDDDGAEGGEGDDGGEGSSSAKKPVYQRGMTRLPPRPDPAQRTLIAPDGEK